MTRIQVLKAELAWLRKQHDLEREKGNNVKAFGITVQMDMLRRRIAKLEGVDY